MPPNAPDQRPGATGAQPSTRVSSPGSLQRMVRPRSHDGDLTRATRIEINGSQGKHMTPSIILLRSFGCQSMLGSQANKANSIAAPNERNERRYAKRRR